MAIKNRLTAGNQTNLISGLMASATVVHGDSDVIGLCFIITIR